MHLEDTPLTLQAICRAMTVCALGLSLEEDNIHGEWIPEQDQVSTSKEDRQERLRVRQLRVPATDWDLHKKIPCLCLFLSIQRMNGKGGNRN